jgi:hypothetical protein
MGEVAQPADGMLEMRDRGAGGPPQTISRLKRNPKKLCRLIAGGQSLFEMRASEHVSSGAPIVSRFTRGSLQIDVSPSPHATELACWRVLRGA